ncbi:hypothetical protein DPMN_004411 [Dreissena polymorpha]|uniref:Uncharacterized protein n=1 Tax=Dreissena polymorpha TaxID=45954 RepID=A0A9D4MRP4_DREPO|nr:hypothetical protein DPMN_004411 [Dreissena polymorpha]
MDDFTFQLMKEARIIQVGANQQTNQPTDQQTGQKQYVPHYNMQAKKLSKGQTRQRSTAPNLEGLTLRPADGQLHWYKHLTLQAMKTVVEKASSRIWLQRNH